MKKGLVAALVSSAAILLSAPVAQAGDVKCVGVLGGPIPGNVIVPPGATCQLKGATVEGNVKALENSRLFVSESHVRGNIEGDKAEVVQVTVTTVGGNIIVKDGEVADAFYDVALCNNTLPNGKIHVEKMTGDIFVGHPTTLVGLANPVLCGGNTVPKGDIQLIENRITQASGTGDAAGLSVRDNDVGNGNIQVFKQRGPAPKYVQGNTVIDGNLQCFENDPPFVGGPNAAEKAEGQCR